MTAHEILFKIKVLALRKWMKKNGYIGFQNSGSCMCNFNNLCGLCHLQTRQSGICNCTATRPSWEKGTSNA